MSQAVGIWIYVSLFIVTCLGCGGAADKFTEFDHTGNNRKSHQPEIMSPYLSLSNEQNTHTFSLTTPSSFIQISQKDISSYQIRNRRTLSLTFRTRLPDALLLYHGLQKRPKYIKKYELYVMLDQGQLKVKHLFGDYSTTLEVGKGLNQDRWHNVLVSIDPNERIILAKVDEHEITQKSINGLDTHRLYGAGDVELESTIFIGGINASVEHLEVSYLANTFIGCIRNAKLETSKAAEGSLKTIMPLVSKEFNNIKMSCINKCWERTVRCSRDSRCINHYDHVECDCFQARFKGERCKDTSVTELTLSGYSYVTFTVFEWMNRVHSDSNRISMNFKTKRDDSILFYASGELSYHNHVGASIKNDRLIVDIDFGNKDELIRVEFREAVTDGNWHIFTISHEGNNVTITLDQQKEIYQLAGDNKYLYIHPDVYVGGGGLILKNRRGLDSSNTFVGCLKEVYFNEKSILFELKQKNLKARHHGITPPAFGACSPRATVPITIPFPDSGFKIHNPQTRSLNLQFSFKTIEHYGTLAYSEFYNRNIMGYWELKFAVREVVFEINMKASAYGQKKINISVAWDNKEYKWHEVFLGIYNGVVNLRCNNVSETANFSADELAAVIYLGTSQKHLTDGFLGCIQNIIIENKELDGRSIVGSENQIGEIALDSCQFVDPCRRPNVCGHGGKCHVIRGKLRCDCAGTGYIGDHCRFATYKRTCEELALLGYTQSGEHVIDIDGNGPYQPARVKCQFETQFSGETKTIVEHNLPNETTVWEAENDNQYNFKMDIKYRAFTPEMLLALVLQSVQCTQYIKFDCYKAKLGLHQYTWFDSADQNALNVASIGDAKRNACPCHTEGACVNRAHCNCDSGRDMWLSDEGYFTMPERLGITRLNFIYPHKLDRDSQARITLGPLECVEANHELTFRYILNGQPNNVSVRSKRRLSDGNWQQVWIDHDSHQVRFQINRKHQMINLKDGQQFGPFEGTMFIAGAPGDHLKEIEVKDGLIGCFRGLVMNGQVVDLYSYMKFHKADIAKDCSPSCEPNPCKNGALCIENWGSYSCACSNVFAHTGVHCETDINTDGLTFLSQNSYIKEQIRKSVSRVKSFLDSNIILNIRTYDYEALILYANDNCNNFVQVRLSKGTHLHFSWNEGTKIRDLYIDYKNLNHGISIQVAVIRNDTHVTLHVNEQSKSVKSKLTLLDQYEVYPWENPEKEYFTPPRPFAPISSYYQLFLGGYDNSGLKPISNSTFIPGMLGCLRGLKVKSETIEIRHKANDQDVLKGCKMICDSKPCKNNGLCLEDFTNQTYTCDCTYTSFEGELCNEGKGVTFEGFSLIRRRFRSPDPNVSLIEARFGFSAVYSGVKTLLWTAYTPGHFYYLIFALNPGGHIVLEEYIDGRIFKTTVRSQNFGDGTRHAIYYKRSDTTALLIVDQEEIPVKINTEKLEITFPMISEEDNIGEVYVAGVSNYTIPKLMKYKRFQGCISHLFIKIDELEMRPTGEYMGVVEKPRDLVIDEENKDGMKLAPCNKVDSAMPKLKQASIFTKEFDWVEAEGIGIPLKEKLELPYIAPKETTQLSFGSIAIALAVYLSFLCLGIGLYMYKLHKRYQIRKQEELEDMVFNIPSPLNYNFPEYATRKEAYDSDEESKADMLLESDSLIRHRSNGRVRVHNIEDEFGRHSGASSERIDDDNASGRSSLQRSESQSHELLSSTSSKGSISSPKDDAKSPDTLIFDEDSGQFHKVPNNSSPSPTLEKYEAVDGESEVSSPDTLTDVIPRIGPLSLRNAKSPIHLSGTCRTLEKSPIVIIGKSKDVVDKRKSIDSVLSLD